MNFEINDLRIGVVGLGYVGLPLAVELGRRYPTVGFDVKASRVEELKAGTDSTLEVSPDELAGADQLVCSSDVADLDGCNFYIVTVPTPIGSGNRPLLTVNEDWCVGYSPERINPGDKEHRLPSILKVTSGSTPDAARFIDAVYASIIPAGTHLASSIKVAEAAKVIENTQRDVNIALINELAMIFERVGIDTQEVLEAAGTKWNFLPFRPGLVGGHCIGVDPYYLTYKAQQLGYHPQMILAGRRINDNMPLYVASRVIRLMLQREIQPKGSKVLVMGLAFKENCPDVRNTKVVDIIHEMQLVGANVDVHDPWVSPEEAKAVYGIDLVEAPEQGAYDVVILAVAHRQFGDMGEAGLKALGKPASVFFDIKYLLPAGATDGRL